MNQEFDFVALKLCGVLGVVYAIQMATGFDPAFSAQDSPFYKFFTSILGHGSLEHLLNNLFFIGLFGSLLERYTSGRKFLTVFFASALLANFSAFIFFPESSIIGASGGGMGIMAALAVYRPHSTGLALGVPVPMWAALVMYVFIDLAGLTGVNNVANEAHLMGMIVGAAIGLGMREEENEDDEEDTPEVDNWEKKIREWEDKWMR